MHTIQKLSLGVGMSLLATEEITKHLYEDIYDGVIFVGSGIKVQHKFINYLNNQNTKFMIIGDGYHEWRCDDFEKIGAENIFLYANISPDQENNFSLDLCETSHNAIREQLGAVLKNTSYTIPYMKTETKPSVVEIFGSRSEVGSEILREMIPDTVIVSHSSADKVAMKSISDYVILEMMSKFVNDVYYRFILSILLNPDKSTFAVGDQKFSINPLEDKLCSSDEIINFQDVNARKFKEFYSSFSENLTPKISESRSFFENEDLPDFYKELQEKYLKNFKISLLLQNIFLDKIEEAECLLGEEGVDIDSSLYNGVTPLFLSIANGNQGLVEFCLAKGADINLARDNRVTPLMVASHFGRDEIVDLLLDNGANMMLDKPQNALTISYQKEHSGIAAILMRNAINSEYAHELRQFVHDKMILECGSTGQTQFQNIYHEIFTESSESYSLGLFVGAFGISESYCNCLAGMVE